MGNLILSIFLRYQQMCLYNKWLIKLPALERRHYRGDQFSQPQTQLARVQSALEAA